MNLKSYALILIAFIPALAPGGTCANTLFPFTDPRVGYTEPIVFARGGYSAWWLRRAGEFFADKEYGPGTQLDYDLAAFHGQKWVETLGGPTGLGLPRFFRPLPARRFEGRAWRGYRIGFAPGRTVNDLVEDVDGVSPEVRQRVEAGYRLAFARFLAAVESRLGPQHVSTWWTSKHGLTWVLVHVPCALLSGVKCPDEYIQIAVKPDNIVVDPWTLEMTTFDFY